VLTLLGALVAGALMLVSARCILCRLGGEPLTMRRRRASLPRATSPPSEPEYGGEDSLGRLLVLLRANCATRSRR
jgi:hypothetical protein